MVVDYIDIAGSELLGYANKFVVVDADNTDAGLDNPPVGILVVGSILVVSGGLAADDIPVAHRKQHYILDTVVDNHYAVVDFDIPVAAVDIHQNIGCGIGLYHFHDSHCNLYFLDDTVHYI